MYLIFLGDDKIKNIGDFQKKTYSAGFAIQTHIFANGKVVCLSASCELTICMHIHDKTWPDS